MGALAMTAEPETASVTMLRKPATPPAGAEAPHTATPDSAEPPAATGPAVAPQAMSASIPAPGLLQRVTRSKALWGGVAAVALLLGLGATAMYITPSPQSLMHATASEQTAVARKADANSSGITPPDLGTPPAAAVKPATAPATNTATMTPASAAPTPAAAAPITVSTTPAVPALATPSAQTAGEKTALDTTPDQPAARSTTSGEDQLFMEMSRKLTEMTTRIDTLEQKLDASQHALHDQLVSGLGNVGGRLDELRHREDTLEASQTVHAPPSPVTPAAIASAPSTPASARNDSHKNTEAAATHHTPSAPQPAERPAPRPHYTVQAGAPDIAILESPQGQPVRVQPGSMLEGWGAVTAVTQSGSGWVVHTEHGTIR